MKRIIVALMLAAGFSSAVMACPAGTHPHGGVGPHHAGGYCSISAE